jgi:hypothetical protein
VAEDLAALGLCALADAATLRTLPGSVWAARITTVGCDVLSHADSVRPWTSRAPLPRPPDCSASLTPAELAVLRRYLHLDAPQIPPAQGLDQAVHHARFDPATGRWLLDLDAPQVASLTCALFLEHTATGTAPANRFARTYGLVYLPATGTRPTLFDIADRLNSTTGSPASPPAGRPAAP